MELFRVKSRGHTSSGCYPATRNVRQFVKVKGFPVHLYLQLVRVDVERDPLLSEIYRFSQSSPRICLNQDVDPGHASVASTLAYYLDLSRVTGIREVLLSEGKESFTHVVRVKGDDAFLSVVKYVLDQGYHAYELVRDYGHLEPPRTFYSLSHYLSGTHEIRFRLPSLFVSVRYSQKMWWLKWTVIRAYLSLRYGIH